MIDKTAPKLVSTLPKKGAITVSVNQDIELTFNEKINTGTGNIIISNGVNDTQIIALPAPPEPGNEISLSNQKITLNLAKNLLPNSHYTIKIDNGAIQDLSGNKYAGIQNTTTLFFDTVDQREPSLKTPLAITTIASNSNIVLNFDEKIQAGTGNITLVGGSDSRTIAITDKQVKISGTTLTINPTVDLNIGSTYKVHLDAGAIKDLAPVSNSATAIDFSFITKEFVLSSAYHEISTKITATTDITALTASDFALLSIADLVGMTKSQVESITAEQMSTLSSTTLPIIWPALGGLGFVSPDVSSHISPYIIEDLPITRLTTTQIAAFSPDQLNALTPAQVATLSKAQISAIPDEYIPALNIAGVDIANIDSSKIADLSAEQIGNLSSLQINALTPNQVGTLTDENTAILHSRETQLNVEYLGNLAIPVSKVFLGKNSLPFNAGNTNLMLFGGAGKETVNIIGDVSAIKVDQNIETVSFEHKSDAYLFKQAGNTLKVYDASNPNKLIASIPVQQDGTDLLFDGQLATVNLSANAVMTATASRVETWTNELNITHTLNSTHTYDLNRAELANSYIETWTDEAGGSHEAKTTYSSVKNTDGSRTETSTSSEDGQHSESMSTFDSENNLIDYKTKQYSNDLSTYEETYSKTNNDNQSPVLQSFTSGGDVSDNIRLTFQENIKIGKGTFTLSDGTASILIPVSDTSQISIVNNVLIINPVQNLNSEKLYILTAPKGIVTDLANNVFAGISATAPFTFDTHDKTPPTLVIKNDKASTTNSAIVYTFTASEAIKNFTVDDITVTGGIKSGFNTVSPTVYTLSVTPDANSTTPVTINVAAGKFTDIVGNQNVVAFQNSQAVDTTPPVEPTIAFKTDTGTAGDNITVSNVIQVSGLEDPTAGTTWEYSVDAGKTYTAGTGSTFNVDFAKTYAKGNIVVHQTDLAGNVSVAATNSADWTILPNEAVTPSTPALVVTPQAVSAAGTASASTGNMTFNFSAGTYQYTISGFSSGDSLNFPSNSTPTIINSYFTDGSVDVQWKYNDNIVTIHLTGLASTQDNAIHDISSFNNIFGNGSIGTQGQSFALT